MRDAVLRCDDGMGDEEKRQDCDGSYAWGYKSFSSALYWAKDDGWTVTRVATPEGPDQTKEVHYCPVCSGRLKREKGKS